MAPFIAISFLIYISNIHLIIIIIIILILLLVDLFFMKGPFIYQASPALAHFLFFFIINQIFHSVS